MNILIVDDEVALLEALQQTIASEGHQVDIANNGGEGHDLAVSRHYDLLILDWMLPGCSGLELCKRLRNQGDRTPVLFLTAKDTLDDRVMGLDAGADDYIVKPFELRELLARVRALLRRSQSIAASLSSVDASRTAFSPDIELDRSSRLAYRNNRAIELSEKETDLLVYFLENYGQVLSHQQIYAALWGEDNSPHSNVLAALIRLLRRKITLKSEDQLIHTVYGKGYRFGSKRDRSSGQEQAH
ncbi:MAG: DNA-binding response regulator [Oscillatoriales cyanobacterium]|nr:MAG: DNA-binding response regulator [Oscillatoriales cyanobacterium]